MYTVGYAPNDTGSALALARADQSGYVRETWLDGEFLVGKPNCVGDIQSVF